MSKRYKIKEREQLIETVRTSGEPVKVVAERMGVKESTAYLWIKRARAARPPEFARVIPTAERAKASMSIEVTARASCLCASAEKPPWGARFLREAVRADRHSPRK